MNGTTISHYELGLELGRGGMGVVYRARDSALDRTVAVKFLAPGMTSNVTAHERFVREAKAAAAIEHASICSIHEIGETEDGQTYIVMPYYEGVTLKELVSSGRQSPLKALQIGRQVASGLAAAHEKGVIHRDIKPGNIMLTARDRAIILDFGLAKLTSGSDLTRSRSSVGTLPYMAPEQIRRERVDERTDIWGLGAVLYELVSGRRPFQGEYDAAVSYEILNADPPPLRTICDDLPDGFCDIVGKCLSKNPDNRYQSADELLEDLKAPEGSIPPTRTSSLPLSAWQHSISGTTRKRLAVGLFAAVVIAVGFVTLSRLFVGVEAIPKHLAVLDFVVEDPEQHPDLQAFAYGLQAEIVDRLRQHQLLDESIVLVPMSRFDAPTDVLDAQVRYGASHVLKTSIAQAVAGPQITHTLIDVTGESPVASDSTFYALNEATFSPFQALRSISDLLGSSITRDDASRSEDFSSVHGANIAYLKGFGHVSDLGRTDVDLAIDYLSEAIEMDSLYATAQAALGAVYLKKYDSSKDSQWLDPAILHSRAALRLDGQNTLAHNTLGSIYVERGKNEEALDEFEHALASDSTNPEIFRLRGAPFREIGDMEAAARSLRHAVDLAPNAWRFHSSLGAHYLETGEFELAHEHFRNGLKLSPDRLSLQNNVGIALKYMERLAEAENVFQDLININPNYTSARKNLATVQFYLDEYEQAAMHYEIVLAQRPSDSEVRGFLADALLWANDDPEKAFAHYQQALDEDRMLLLRSDRNPDILARIAWYFANLGVPDSAFVYLQRTEEAFMDGAMSGEDAFGLGETYVVLGDFDTGKYWIDQGLALGAEWSRFNHSPWLDPIHDDEDFMNRIQIYRN